MVTWSFLGLNTCFWAVSLGGVAALSKVYSGPNSNYQVPVACAHRPARMHAAFWSFRKIGGSISI